jgi:hypothetical protein
MSLWGTQDWSICKLCIIFVVVTVDIFFWPEEGPNKVPLSSSMCNLGHSAGLLGAFLNPKATMKYLFCSAAIYRLALDCSWSDALDCIWHVTNFFLDICSFFPKTNELTTVPPIGRTTSATRTALSGDSPTVRFLEQNSLFLLPIPQKYIPTVHKGESVLWRQPLQKD